jgi:Pilus formation protein N terminal region
MKRRSTVAALAALAAVASLASLAAGCSTPRNVTLTAAGSSPAGSFTPGLATIPVGVVLGFDTHVESSTPVTASVDDPSVATVAPTTQGSQFVLIGLVAGQTTLHVYVNDQESTELPVQVIAPAD